MLKLSELVPPGTVTNVHLPVLPPTSQPQVLTGTQTTLPSPLLPSSASGFESCMGYTLKPAKFVQWNASRVISLRTGKSFPDSKIVLGAERSKQAEKHEQHGHQALSKTPRTLFNPWGPVTGTIESSRQVAEVFLTADSGPRDCEAFLLDKFKKIKLLYQLDESWLPNDIFLQLPDIIKDSVDLASLLIRYLRDPLVGNPESQLRRLLCILEKATDAKIQEPLPLHDLFYLDILRRIPLDTYAVVKRILVSQGLVTGSTRDENLALACGTLGIPQSKAYEGLRYLHPAMYIPSPQDITHKNITIYSDSFPTFLNDPSRSGDYAIIMEGWSTSAVGNAS